MKKILIFTLPFYLFSSCIASKTSVPTVSAGKIKVVEIFGIPKPTSPYSLGIWGGDNLYLAGQLGTDPITGKLMDKSFNDETNAVMKNLETVLKSAGLDFSNVVKTTVYLTDLKDFQAMNDIYKTYFKNGQFPARETVQVVGLMRGAHIEISMIAHK
jgi:2-iminobutanoate/2-iminopropanoate deaminase